MNNAAKNMGVQISLRDPAFNYFPYIKVVLLDLCNSFFFKKKFIYLAVLGLPAIYIFIVAHNIHLHCSMWDV